MSHSLNLPVGPYPGWELQDEEIVQEGSALHTIAESSIVLQSLRQSREKWLSTTFPKFSAKSRGGRPPAILPPPHTIKAHGKFDLNIGPHIFKNTSLYEVHYLPQAPPASASTVPTYPSTPPYGQAGTPQMQPYSSTTIPYGAPPTLQTPVQTSSPVSTLTTDAFVTPALISQVNSAAASNPILSNLLHEAAAGRASPDQLKTLGLLIQTLGGLGQEPQLTAPSTTVAPVPMIEPNSPVPIKDFDIIVEFQERPSDRWIFPRGPVVCELDPPGSSCSPKSDLIMHVPFPLPRGQQNNANAVHGSQAGSNEQGEASITQFVDFRWAGVSKTVYELLMRWIGGESKNLENRKLLDEISQRPPKRSYLQYQLPDGELLTQIQTAVAPPMPTKSIKPAQADGTKSRRRTSTRKAAPTPTRTPAASPALKTPPIPSPATPNAPSPLPSADATPLKRKRSGKTKVPNTPPVIACRVCGQTDVPLMMGGRFCRPCLDSGKFPVGAVPAATTSTTTMTDQETGSAYASVSCSTQAPPPMPTRHPSNVAPSPLFAPSPLGTHPPVVSHPQTSGDEG